MSETISAVTQELLGLYDELSEVSVDVAYARSTPFAHGWYTRCRRSAQALLLLAEHGFSHEAAPLRRALIEHSACLHWLANAPDGAVDSLLWGHQRRMDKLQKAMRGEWVVPDDAFEVLEVKVENSSERTNLAFAHLCQRYEFHDWYVAWLTETGFSHPCFSSALAYGVANDEGEIELLARVPALIDDRAVVATLLLLASQGMNQMLAGEPWADRLELIASRLSEAVVPSSTTPLSDHLPHEP